MGGGHVCGLGSPMIDTLHRRKAVGAAMLALQPTHIIMHSEQCHSDGIVHLAGCWALEVVTTNVCFFHAAVCLLFVPCRM
jgi:hypothetical protein